MSSGYIKIVKGEYLEIFSVIKRHNVNGPILQYRQLRKVEIKGLSHKIQIFSKMNHITPPFFVIKLFAFE